MNDTRHKINDLKSISTVRVRIGLHEIRPCPGAVAYQAIAAQTTTSTYHKPVSRAYDDDGSRTSRSVVLAMAEAPSQNQADEAHTQLMTYVAPLLAAGQGAVSAAVARMRDNSIRDGHQVLLWSDGSRARLLFQGSHRIIYLHDDKASLIRPSVPDGLGECELALTPGDILVVVAHATHAQLPLGTVAAIARQATDPQALCVTATEQAATSDPMSHHAAVALWVGPAIGDED
jgi:hypothetical protein